MVHSEREELNHSLPVVILLVCVGSLYIVISTAGVAVAQLEASAIICEDNEPCKVQISNSSGTFRFEGPANVTASMTPLESSLFDYEMELFDREMD
jgi:hypothetical protein